MPSCALARYVLHATPATEERMRTVVDEFGDHFTRPITAEELRSLLVHVPNTLPAEGDSAAAIDSEVLALPHEYVSTSHRITQPIAAD